MRMSLLSALSEEMVWMRRTWTGRIDRDGPVVHDPTSFGRLRLHENECLFCALLVSSFSKGVQRDVPGRQP
jgi:hypothetical protein